MKPANVLVSADGRACLTDFGIATTTGDSSLTTYGALIGSPSYMAPERAHGEEPRPPVDLWSLGATLYAAVEGRPPFDRGEAMATLLSVVSEHPAPMLRAGPLEPVLSGLLTKDPDRRTLRGGRPVAAGGRRGRPGTGTARSPRARAPTPGARARARATSMERIDSDDLRALASASKALLGSVARDARDQARHLRGTRRERKESRPVAKQARPLLRQEGPARSPGPPKPGSGSSAAGSSCRS